MNQESSGFLPIRRAILSVSDKTGLLELAQCLVQSGTEILSTGGTAKLLEEAGIPTMEVSDFTGFPEMMEGRLKTLHPKVHGGLLMRRGKDEAMAMEHGILPIDLVVVNLYPFEETVAKEGTSYAEAIEKIDIGGPGMLRSAAKNHASVAALCEVEDYAKVIQEIQEKGALCFETRKYLALKVFERTSRYDHAISQYFRQELGMAETLDLHYVKLMKLRYGENPHQKAAFFKDAHDDYPNVTNAKVLQGKELSYNNIIDTDAALELVKDYDIPAAAVIKHMNPCGAATASTIEKAFELAHEVDPMSAFGSIIALNRPCNGAVARLIQEKKMFVEIVVAPSFDEEALELLAKRNDLRLLETGPLGAVNPAQRSIRTVAGGILVQNADLSIIKEDDLKKVTKTQASPEDIEAMLFARVLVKHVKSNAVAFAKKHEFGGCVATGIGAGQMSRVDSVIIARRKGGDKVPGSIMASDAFFPFPDAVEEAFNAGVRAIIQPGGSIRDEEVIAKADELGLAMVFTGVRSFKH